MARPDFLLTTPPEWTDQLVTRRVDDEPLLLSLAYDPEQISLPESLRGAAETAAESTGAVRTGAARTGAVRTEAADTGAAGTGVRPTTSAAPAPAAAPASSVQPVRTSAGSTKTAPAPEAQAASVQPVSVTPASVQPVSVTPASVQPVSVTPASVQPVSVTPASAAPASGAPASGAPASAAPTSAAPASAVSASARTAALLERVAADLSQGAWLSRPRKNGAARLGGPTYELRVERRSWEGTDRPGAVVTAVTEVRTPPAKADRFAAVAKFAPLAEKPTCDLDEIAKILVGRRDERRRHRRQLGRTASPQRELAAHAELRNEMRRRYGGLGYVLAGLDPRRCDRTEGVVAGTETARGRWRLVVDCPDGGAARFRRRRVRLTGPDGTGFVARVLAARDDQIKVELPDGWSAAQRSQVTVEMARSAGARHDPLALDDLLAGRVEGSWEDLALLLSDPGSLRLRTALQMPSKFYCDDDPEAPALNGDQRRAVAGAVSTPHAFFVQSPPGTGSSTVIGEVVRQLVGRGERVLLLAPSPAAFASTVSGLQHDPAVRPMLITDEDEQVTEALRGYLPQAVGMTSGIRRPAESGRAARWGRERTSTEHSQERADRLRPLVERYEKAAASAAAAVTAGENAQRLLERAKTRAEETTARLMAAIAADEEALATATADSERSAAEEESARAELMPALVALRDAADEVIRAGHASAEATEVERVATLNFERWDGAHAEAVRKLELRRGALEQHPAEHRLREAVQRARVVETAVASADAQRGGRMGGRRAESARMRREVAEASSAVDHWLGELARRDAELSDLVAEHNKLAADAAVHEPAMRGEVERRQADRHRSDIRLTAAVQGLEEALRRLNLEISRPRAGYEMPPTWQDYGRMLHEWLVPAIQGSTEQRPIPPELGLDGLAEVADRVRRATADHRAAQTRRRAAEQDYEQHSGELDMHRRESETQIGWHAYHAAGAVEDAERQQQSVGEMVERFRVTASEFGYADLPTLDDLATEDRLSRWRRHVVTHMPWLEQRWRELTEERNDDELSADLRSALVRSANLICATSRGLVGPGGELVGHTDFDTMIVDDASRVTESEFLAGAVHARRWVMVGDEHLPPRSVPPDDEYLLHALVALHRLDRSGSGQSTVAKAVDELAGAWAEEPDERRTRTRAVRTVAHQLDTSGEWDSRYREAVGEAYGAFGLPDRASADLGMLRAAVRYLGESPFGEAVAEAPSLCQPLVVQRRMAAPLARVLGEPVYRGRYQSPSTDELTRTGVSPLVVNGRFDRPVTFLDTSDRDDAGDRTSRAGGSVNPLEQDLIVELCEEYDEALAAVDSEPVTVSVLALSRAQARALARRIRSTELTVLRPEVVDVAEAADTGPSDLVVVSLTRVRPEPDDAEADESGEPAAEGFDSRRLAAACGRARRALVLVGHGDTLRRSGEGAARLVAHLTDLAGSDPEVAHRRLTP